MKPSPEATQLAELFAEHGITSADTNVIMRLALIAAHSSGRSIADVITTAARNVTQGSVTTLSEALQHLAILNTGTDPDDTEQHTNISTLTGPKR